MNESAKASITEKSNGKCMDTNRIDLENEFNTLEGGRIVPTFGYESSNLELNRLGTA